MKYFSEYFVSIRQNPGKHDDRLSFVVNKDPKRLSDFSKRCANARSWANIKDHPPIDQLFANIPTEGFHILSTQSRYSTSNKVWRVKDPRGWIFEIYCDNLEYLIENCIINRGVIEAALVYIKTAKGDLSIYPPDMPDIINGEEKVSKLKISQLTPEHIGMVFKHQHNYYVYAGKHLIIRSYGKKGGTYSPQHQNIFWRDLNADLRQNVDSSALRGVFTVPQNVEYQDVFLHHRGTNDSFSVGGIASYFDASSLNYTEYSVGQDIIEEELNKVRISHPLFQTQSSKTNVIIFNDNYEYQQFVESQIAGVKIDRFNNYIDHIENYYRWEAQARYMGITISHLKKIGIADGMVYITAHK